MRMKVFLLYFFSFLVFLLLFALFIISCSQNAGDLSFCVAAWNVQSLFDGVTQGTEYSEFQNLWSKRDFNARIKDLCSVISAMNPGPDIIFLQEIENDTVLNEMCTGYLYRKGYLYYGCTADPDSPIQTGFISRVPVAEEDIAVIGTAGQRPVLRVIIATDNGKIAMYSLHLKSRTDGDMQTEAQRVAVVKSVLEDVKRIRRSGDCSVILLCGDFNEDLRLSEEIEGVQTAFVRAGSRKELLYPDSLILSGEEQQVSGNTRRWYCFWEDGSQNLGLGGSYYYQEHWNRLDNILVSSEGFDYSGWDFQSGGVYSDARLFNGSGVPDYYNVKTKTGMSDHLPVYVTLSPRSPSPSP